MLLKYLLTIFSTLLLFTACSKVINEESNSQAIVTVIQEEGKSKPEQRSFHPLSQNPEVTKYCKDKVQPAFDKYAWGDAHCMDLPWMNVRKSHKGDPLVWIVFGDETKRTTQTNTTIILCTIHGDEIVPTKFCFDIIFDLYQNPNHLTQNDLVIVAPIVNPDSFFINKPSRVNAKGVDINRNFPTRDWHKSALPIWIKNYRRDPRRFPGSRPLTEPEVVFQVNLLNRYKPNKIISIHAPLTLLDYDGPAKTKTGKAGGVDKNLAMELLIQMSEKASGYKVSNYPYFPGSLGNYAGNELRVPTYTLELPTTDWHKTDDFWKRFQPAIIHAIQESFDQADEETAANFQNLIDP
jgi:protein MpaA